MIIRVLFTTALALSGLMLSAQQAGGIMTYRHMTGSADSNTIRANFLRQNEQISGNYEMETQEENDTYEVYGTIDNNNQTALSPFGTDDPVLQGTLEDKSFTGIWKSGNVEVNVTLTESYPPGTLPFRVHYLHSEENLVQENPKSPTAEIEMTLLFPEASPHVDRQITERIKKIIAATYVESPELLDPDSLLVAAEKDFYSLYRENSEDWEGMEWAFSWTRHSGMSVIYNSNSILCLEYLNYVYTGGAHGMTSQRYDIIDLNTGNVLSFEDIFKKEKKKQLAAIIMQQLRNDYRIADHVPLTEAGFFDDSIQPSENLYLNGSGIGFTYSLYEIAPYAMGNISVFLEYGKLKELIREDCTVFRFVKK